MSGLGKRRIRVIRETAIMVAAALAAMTSMSSAQTLQKITVGVPNGIGLTDTTAHLALTMELGYFKEEGLEIDFVNFRGTAILLPQVAGKTIDIGWARPTSPSPVSSRIGTTCLSDSSTTGTAGPSGSSWFWTRAQSRVLKTSKARR